MIFIKDTILFILINLCICKRNGVLKDELTDTWVHFENSDSWVQFVTAT